MFLILAHFDCVHFQSPNEIVCLQIENQRVEKQSGKCIQNVKAKQKTLGNLVE